MGVNCKFRIKIQLRTLALGKKLPPATDIHRRSHLIVSAMKKKDDLSFVEDGKTGWQHIFEAFLVSSFRISAREEMTPRHVWLSRSHTKDDDDRRLHQEDPHHPYNCFNSRYPDEHDRILPTTTTEKVYGVDWNPVEQTQSYKSIEVRLIKQKISETSKSGESEGTKSLEEFTIFPYDRLAIDWQESDIYTSRGFVYKKKSHFGRRLRPQHVLEVPKLIDCSEEQIDAVVKMVEDLVKSKKVTFEMICDLIEYLVNATENPKSFPISKYLLHKMAQIVCNNYSGYASYLDNKQLTTLMALCDAVDVVQPLEDALENFMLLQQPARKQYEIQARKEQINKVRKYRPEEGAAGNRIVERERKMLDLLESDLQKVQDECFNGKPSVQAGHRRIMVRVEDAGHGRRGFVNARVQVNRGKPSVEDHWQQKIKEFVRDNFGMGFKAKTAFIVELVMRGKQN